MNSLPVSAIEEVTRARLATIHADAALTEVATRMSSSQISLVVVCDAGGAMVGVITKTDFVKRMAEG